MPSERAEMLTLYCNGVRGSEFGDTGVAAGIQRSTYTFLGSVRP